MTEPDTTQPVPPTPPAPTNGTPLTPSGWKQLDAVLWILVLLILFFASAVGFVYFMFKGDMMLVSIYSEPLGNLVGALLTIVVLVSRRQ